MWRAMKMNEMEVYVLNYQDNGQPIPIPVKLSDTLQIFDQDGIEIRIPIKNVLFHCNIGVIKND